MVGDGDFDLADAFRPPEDAVPGGLLRDEVPEGWQRDADSGRLQRAVGDSGDAAAE